MISTKGIRQIEFKYKGSPYEVKLPKGSFLFEAWGASGGAVMCGNTFTVRILL